MEIRIKIERPDSKQQRSSLFFYPGEKNKGRLLEAIAQGPKEECLSLLNSHLADEGKSFCSHRVFELQDPRNSSLFAPKVNFADLLLGFLSLRFIASMGP